MNAVLGPSFSYSQRHLRWLMLLLLAGLSLEVNCRGQTADSFNPGVAGGAADVESLAVQPDGSILVGGSFSSLGGKSHYSLGRVSTNGVADTLFNPMDSTATAVSCLNLQADGTVLVAGTFATVCGQPHSYLARLEADGNLDESFVASPDSSVNALAEQPDGAILVGGNFRHLDGQVRTHLGRLEPDGTLDTNFDVSLDGGVNSIALQTNGDVLIGGSFTNVNGQALGQLARLAPDGTLDTNFLGTADAPVIVVAVQPDGKILVGGAFKSLDGQGEAYFGRLNSDGSLDTAFNPACNGRVFSVALQADGKIILGGFFSSVSGQSVTNLARLNTDGTLDSTFNAAAGSINALGLQQDGKLLVGGFFNTLAGQSRTNIGRLNNTDAATQSLTFDTSSITWLRGGTSPEVLQTTFEVLEGGTNWVSLGEGTRVPGGWQLNGLTLATNANVRATGIVVGSESGASSWPVQAIAGAPLIIVQPQSQVVSTGKTAVISVTAGGTGPLTYQWQQDGTNLPGATGSSLTLTNIGAGDIGSYDVVISNSMGVTVSSIGELLTAAPVIADSFAPHVQGQITVQAIAVQPDGKVLLASASSLGGGAPAYLARVNPDGSADTTFYSSPTAGANNTITAIAVQPDLKILAGGYFTTFNGKACASICRLGADGVLDASFTAGTGGQVYCLALQPDGKILIGGIFTTVDGQSHANLARLNSDGTLDTNFTAAVNGTVYCVGLQEDGNILVGGQFTTLDGQSNQGLGRLLPDGSLDTSFKPNMAGYDYALAVQADGRIVVGGNFSALAGQSRANIGRLNPDGTLDTTFNPGSDTRINTFALQADGKIIVGGSFFALAGSIRYLGRLNPDGTPDSTFSPAIGGAVQCVTIQPDGKVLVGGGFRSLGGQNRTYVGRLNNTDPATQTLSLSASQLTWMRGGTAPEVWSVSFEASTNGVDWLSLGEGVRIPGGWTLSAPMVPPGATVRANGFVLNDGIDGWFLQDLIFQQKLAILTADGNFGIHPSGFGFNIVGGPGQTAVVEFSADLVHWTALQTNVIGQGPASFVDPSWTNSSVGFYRLMAQ